MFLMVCLLNILLLLLLRDLSLSLIVWAVLIMRTYNLPLAVLQLLLGYCLAWIGATPFLVIRAIFSSFFYLVSDYQGFSTHNFFSYCLLLCYLF